MTRFLMSIIATITLFVSGIIIGSYIGYFTGMIYSLTNGWMFAVSKEFIASLFGAIGGMFGLVVMSFIWHEAYKEATNKTGKEDGR